MDATIAPTFGKRSPPVLTVFLLPKWGRTVCKFRFKRFNSFRSPTVETVRSGCCGRQKEFFEHCVFRLISATFTILKIFPQAFFSNFCSENVLCTIREKTFPQ